MPTQDISNIQKNKGEYPVFFKFHDLPEDVQTSKHVKYLVAEAAMKVVGFEAFRSLMVCEFSGRPGERPRLWKLFFWTEHARSTAVAKGMEFDGLLVRIYDKNPLRKVNSDGEEIEETKLHISNIPPSFEEEEIIPVLKKKGIVVTSRLKKEFIRKPEGKLTSKEDGCAFLFIQTPKEPLPSVLKVGPITVKLYHKEQKFCDNCRQFGHFKRNCKNKSVCSFCDEEGHTVDECLKFIEEERRLREEKERLEKEAERQRLVELETLQKQKEERERLIQQRIQQELEELRQKEAEEEERRLKKEAEERERLQQEMLERRKREEDERKKKDIEAREKEEEEQRRRKEEEDLKERETQRLREEEEKRKKEEEKQRKEKEQKEMEEKLKEEREASERQKEEDEKKRQEELIALAKLKEQEILKNKKEEEEYNSDYEYDVEERMEDVHEVWQEPQNENEPQANLNVTDDMKEQPSGNIDINEEDQDNNTKEDAPLEQVTSIYFGMGEAPTPRRQFERKIGQESTPRSRSASLKRKANDIDVSLAKKINM